MRFLLIVSFSIVSVAYGQTDVSKKYELKNSYNYTALTLYANSTYNYEFSGCLGAGGDSGTYKLNSDTLELNSLRGLSFAPGGYSLMAFAEKDSANPDSIAIKIGNRTELILKNTRIVFDNFDTLITNEISPNSFFELSVKRFTTNGLFAIEFPTIGRQYSDTISSQGNAYFIILDHNKLSRQQEMPLRQVRFHVLKNKICPITKSNFETNECLEKVKKSKR